LTWRLPPNSTPPEPGFAQAVLPHLDSAYNLARWLVRDPTLAEDIVQEAAMRALSYFPSFRGDNSRAWLMQIVRNVAHSSCTARARATPVSLHASPGDENPIHAIPDPAPTPEAAMNRQQQYDSMEAALLALPPDLRECIVLRELEELSYKEIAEVTGAPIGTVMSRLARARRTLLGRQGEAPPT
jgi:RNA polymerase sigma-70 factor (ECF subfamily)